MNTRNFIGSQALGRRLSLALLLLALSISPGRSAPQLINYQGQLLDPNGAPLPTGDYEMEIQLFPVESGGQPIWGPQKFNGQSGLGLSPKVAVVDGRFNLVLGPKDTADRALADIFAQNPSAFLELKVGTGSPIAPRQQFLASPYAFTAQSAEKLKGFDWNNLFSGGNPQTGNLGLGIAPSEVRLDVNGRVRLRQGPDLSAGLWLFQTTGGDRSFIGMKDDDNVGFWGVPFGWALSVNVNNGEVYSPAPVYIGSTKLYTKIAGFGGFSTQSTESQKNAAPNFILPRTFHVESPDTQFHGAVTATRYVTASDERLKENITPIENSLDRLNNIRGVRYMLKKTEPESPSSQSPPQLGVLAQEVQKAFPEAVHTGADGYLSVNYDALTPVLIQAIKEQQRQIERLQSELTTLKSKLNSQ